MITDEKLRKICFAAAVIGLIGMLAISQLSGPEKLGAGDITDAKLGRIVEVTGNISSFSSKDGNVFIDLQDRSGTIMVVMFERTARNQKSVYDLKKGNYVTVMGKVALYENEMEIQADSIETVDKT